MINLSAGSKVQNVMQYHNSRARYHKGKVLIAQASLQDPNFKQTLIFLTEHNEDGAFGFIMNRPTQQNANFILPDDAALSQIPDMPICFGGPVQNEGVLFAAFQNVQTNEPITVNAGLGGDDLKTALLDKSQYVKAFMGYAGWSAGQLEMELEQDAWKIADPDPALFNTQFSRGIWNAYASNDKRWKLLLPYLPKDPERN